MTTSPHGFQPPRQHHHPQSNSSQLASPCTPQCLQTTQQAQPPPAAGSSSHPSAASQHSHSSHQPGQQSSQTSPPPNTLIITTQSNTTRMQPWWTQLRCQHQVSSKPDHPRWDTTSDPWSMQWQGPIGEAGSWILELLGHQLCIQNIINLSHTPTDPCSITARAWNITASKNFDSCVWGLLSQFPSEQTLPGNIHAHTPTW